MNDSVEQLTRQMHDAFSSNQFDRALDLADENIQVVAYAMGMTFNGKAEFLAFMQGFKSAFPDIAITHSNLVSNGNRVAVEFTASGTHTGTLETPAGPIPPTGRTVSLNGSEFMVWENGKLKSAHSYQDIATLLRQIGAM